MTSTNMDEIKLIPAEILKLIPRFGGDPRELNLFIRQCEYVISMYGGSGAQNTYVLHSIMSRFTNTAATLVSDNASVETWDELKELLVKNFGDPRSEECISIELQCMKIRPGESYFDFYNRIKSVRLALISKLNLQSDPAMKESKMIIYDNIALKTFLYNLPENIVSIARLKSLKNLDEALSFVLEEVNFQQQYAAQKGLIPQPIGSVTFKGNNNYRPTGTDGFNSTGFGLAANQGQVQLFGTASSTTTAVQPAGGALFGSQPASGFRPQAVGSFFGTQQSGKTFGTASTFGSTSQNTGMAGESKSIPKSSNDSNTTSN